MDISRLAAKQKRLLSWAALPSAQALSEAQRKQASTLLAAYRKVLEQFWKLKDAVPDQSLAELASVERQLSQLEESSRLDSGRSKQLF